MADPYKDQWAGAPHTQFKPAPLRDIATLGGQLGQGAKEAEVAQAAMQLAEERGIPWTLENAEALKQEVVNTPAAPPPQSYAIPGALARPEPPATEPPATQPPADTPATTTPPATGGYPGMRSIRGKLGSLEKEIQKETDFQKAEYEQERKDYEKHLEEVSEASQAKAAREKMKFAEGALNTATDKLKNWEIDPHRAFPNAFSKVAAVIGVAMGAYAQGLSGGKLPNTALQIVNSAIDRDIDAQKTEYAKLKGLVDEKRNVYGMAMRLLGDERQADELARSAAYRSFKAQMDSMGRQFGLTNQQMSQKFNVLKLEEQENFHRASLMARAAKGSAKAGKLPKEMTKAASSFGGIQATARSLWDKVGQFSLGPLTGLAHKATPGEQLGDTFNRESEQSLVEMLHAISGVALSKGEYERIKKFFPKSTKMESTNRADIKGLVDWAAKKGAGFYKTMTPQQQAMMAQSTPELVELYLEEDPERRQARIVSMLSQQSQQPGSSFFGEMTQVKE